MMIYTNDLDELVFLMKRHADLVHDFKEKNYDVKISLAKQEGQRQVIQEILQQDQFKTLARQTHFDVCEFAIPEDRETRLTKAIQKHNLWITQAIVIQFCHLVARKLATSEDISDDIKDNKYKIENEIHTIKSDYNHKINTMLTIINSTDNEQDKLNQLLTQDSLHGETIGHLCFRENVDTIFYSNIVNGLSSDKKLQLLSKTNHNSQSIFELKYCTNRYFISLTETMKPEDLKCLLNKEMIFHNALARMRDVECLNYYWNILKQKYSDELSDFFDTDEKKVTWEKHVIQFAQATFLINYINQYHAKMSEGHFDSITSRLTQHPDFKQDTTEERAKILLSYLQSFELTTSAIKTLVNIKHLKKELRKTLLTLPHDINNFETLVHATDNNTSIGQFCATWRKISFSKQSFFSSSKNETKTVRQVRQYSFEMQEAIIPPSAPTTNIPIATPYVNSDEPYKALT